MSSKFVRLIDSCKPSEGMQSLALIIGAASARPEYAALISRL